MIKIYLTTHGSAGIYQWDSTNEDIPTQIPNTNGLGFSGIAIKDDIAYLTTHGSAGIYQYTIGSGNRPTQLPNTGGLGFSGITYIKMLK